MGVVLSHAMPPSETPATMTSPQPESTPKEFGVEQMLNLPNVLTFLRLLMIPVYVGLFATPTAGRALAAAGVFCLAAFTDLLDGHIARQRAQVTSIGRLFDPIADKCLVTAGLVLLVQFQRVEAWLAIALIVRELAVTGVRAAAASRGLVMAAGVLGKYKVVLQITAIMLLTLEGAVSLPDFIPFTLHQAGIAALYAALAFSLLSAGQYLRDVRNDLCRRGIG